MEHIRGCENCQAPAVPGGTLCVDCLAGFALNAGRMAGELENRIARESANAAVIISKKNAEIEDLKYQLRLHKRLISHVFREYQIVRGIKAVDIRL